MIKILGSVLLLTVVVSPARATAQGSRGGFGGGSPGRNGPRGRADTTAAGAPRAQANFVDVVFAHRSDLQLSGAQTTKVNEIRMSAMTRRAALTREVDLMKATLTLSPGDNGASPPTDSSRTEMMQRRRALGSALGDLHDVDVTARDETLALLTPDQKKQAEYLEQVADAPPVTKPQRAPGGERRGGDGGRPRSP